MIERYTLPRMGGVWSLDAKYKAWLKVEIAACEAWAKYGKIPKKSLAIIKRKAKPVDPKRVEEIENVTRHDVIAFIEALAEKVGPESRHIHLGLTSSDVLDTAFAMQLKDAADIIIKDIEALLPGIKKQAMKHKMTLMMGRSHGIHAEPITFGLVLAIWYEEMKRNLKRMKTARETISYGKISGAVGNYTNLDPRVEATALKLMGLKVAPVSNQVVQRDRHAEYFTTLAIIASSLEKFAVEIRHLQRTEVREVEEPFRKGQKGSSAMPHKRNPIITENISGLARLVRANSMAALENVALWHERDISHSSVERVIGPDSTILVDYMLNRFTNLVKDLVVYPENMLKNIELSKGLFFSQAVMLELVKKGMKREEAYVIVQRNAMKVWGTEGLNLKTKLAQDEDVTSRLSKREIEKCFSMKHYTKHVDLIFKRVFGTDSKPVRKRSGKRK